MDKKSKIFQPIKLGNITLKNRIAVAPHGSSLHERDGGAGEKLMAYLRNLARSGAGMVTIGSGNINREGSPVPIAHPGNPFLVGNYVNVTEMMHQYDCKISMQLIPGKEMLMPSDIVVNTATKESIEDLCAQYADAAYNCMQAGFDFIMVHGAHGNGPSMFFSPKFNHRTDEYGGSLENRARFAIEVLDAIRAKCGNKIGIEYRLSAEEMIEGGATFEETLEFARLIQDKIDLLHISRGLLEEDSHLPYVFTPTYFDHAINLKYAKKFKEELVVPVNVIGGFTPELAEKAIADGDVDMVSLCRTFLADPLWVSKVMKGQEEEIRPCVRCNTCINQTHARLWDIRCAVNPLCGRETQFPQYGLPAAKSRNVLMIGGGPANLEAARVAALRGHKVTILEKNNELGGNLRYAAAPAFKADLKKYLDWSIDTVNKNPNIEVRLNCEATKEMVLEENPDVLFVAVGSEPIRPSFTSSGTDKVLWAGDVMTGQKTTGNRVVIAGCGFTGLETALLLSNEGKDVTVVDMIPKERIGADAAVMSMIGLKQLLQERNVHFINEVKVEDITDDGVTIVSLKTGEKTELPCDHAVLSLGMRKNLAAVEAFRGLVPETYVIGDCSNVAGVLWKATRSGFDMAMEI
jgi:2,4-dienoyl-CoA reductase-like NADH-dependent reductase (Old Yellow Enzyme family)/thioredoxin reductase